MKEDIILEPNNDVIFRRLFGKKGNERFTKDLLEAILNIEIESIELDKETQILPENIDEKVRNT